MVAHLFAIHVGKCLKNQGQGLLDGCQAFLPQPVVDGERPLQCLGCGCLVTMHEKEAERSRSQPVLSARNRHWVASGSQAGPSVSVSRSGGLLGSQLSLGAGEQSSSILAGESHQQRDAEVESPVRVQQSAWKRKSSAQVSSPQSPVRNSPQLAEMRSSLELKKAKIIVDLETTTVVRSAERIASPHDENLSRLQASYPPEKYGEFRMVKVKEDWRVHCVACNVDLAPGAAREKLGNVKKHIEGQQKKKDSISKHMQQVATYAERAAAKDERAIQARQSVLAKRKAILAQYREEGELLVSASMHRLLDSLGQRSAACLGLAAASKLFP